MSFRSFLLQQRENAGLTRTALARQMGVSLAYISFLESPSVKKRAPTVERCKQIAKALSLTEADTVRLLDLAYQERIGKEASSFQRPPDKKPIIDASLVSVDNSEMISVPVFSKCPASAKSWIGSDIERYEKISKTFTGGRKMFIMKIHGDSMDRAGINSGDMVLVDIEKTPANGNIVIARVDDECTVKRYYRRDHTVTLAPDSHNPEHQPMVFTKANKILIHGVVDSIYLKKVK
jgi:repressor LexA